MPIVNALTVDVEDYFQVSAFAQNVPRSTWDQYESRVCRNTFRLLDLFDKLGVQGTFFVLGWVAEKFPTLVREIHNAGHELASHSHEHQLVYDLTPEQFTADLRRARAAIEDAASVRVVGYRAPSFSIVASSQWALDVLVSEGYTYDASIYPIRHDRYGIPDWPRHIEQVRRPGGALWEVPGATVRRAGMNLPIGGGGYFRIFPYRWTRSGFATVNEVEGQSAVFYLHPWEVDPEQPRIKSSVLSRMRHYYNLEGTEARLRRLLTDFRFAPISRLLTAQAAESAG